MTIVQAKHIFVGGKRISIELVADSCFLDFSIPSKSILKSIYAFTVQPHKSRRNREKKQTVAAATTNADSLSKFISDQWMSICAVTAPCGNSFRAIWTRNDIISELFSVFDFVRNVWWHQKMCKDICRICVHFFSKMRMRSILLFTLFYDMCDDLNISLNAFHALAISTSRISIVRHNLIVHWTEIDVIHRLTDSFNMFLFLIYPNPNEHTKHVHESPFYLNIYYMKVYNVRNQFGQLNESSLIGYSSFICFSLSCILRLGCCMSAFIWIH